MKFHAFQARVTCKASKQAAVNSFGELSLRALHLTCIHVQRFCSRQRKPPSILAPHRRQEIAVVLRLHMNKCTPQEPAYGKICAHMHMPKARNHTMQQRCGTRKNNTAE